MLKLTLACTNRNFLFKKRCFMFGFVEMDDIGNYESWTGLIYSFPAFKGSLNCHLYATL